MGSALPCVPALLRGALSGRQLQLPDSAAMGATLTYAPEGPYASGELAYQSHCQPAPNLSPSLACPLCWGGGAAIAGAALPAPLALCLPGISPAQGESSAGHLWLETILLAPPSSDAAQQRMRPESVMSGPYCWSLWLVF